MTEPYGLFRVHDARSIKDIVLGKQPQDTGQPPQQFTQGMGPYYAILLDDMDAATSPLDGYVEVTARVLRYALAADNYDMESATEDDPINVINRSQASADAGTLILVMRVGSEFSPIWVDCSASDDGATIAGV